MDNITDILNTHTENNNNNITVITAVFGGLVAVIGAITAYLAKAHIQKSSCYNGKCCNVVCMDEEEKGEVKETLKRLRTDKKRRLTIEEEPTHQTLQEVKIQRDDIKEEIYNEEDEHIYDKLNKEKEGEYISV